MVFIALRNRILSLTNIAEIELQTLNRLARVASERQVRVVNKVKNNGQFLTNTKTNFE